MLGGVFTVVAATAITTPETELRRSLFEMLRLLTMTAAGASASRSSKELTDWRVGSGSSGCPVRREGGRAKRRPLTPILFGGSLLLLIVGVASFP